MERPLKTVTAGGGHAAMVAPYLSAYYGVDQDTPVNEPLHTLTTKPRFGHVEATVSAPPFGPKHEARAREVADFMRAWLWDEREFVTIAIGESLFVIVDIGMRMLTPRELYTAQGFPADYVIDGAWDYHADGAGPVWVDFPKSVQVSCVGNSVSPPVMAALIGANCPDLAEWREAAE